MFGRVYLFKAENDLEVQGQSTSYIIPNDCVSECISWQNFINVAYVYSKLLYFLVRFSGEFPMKMTQRKIVLKHNLV